METQITIRGARENNLKNIQVNIPRNRFIVITGLSGSGKSSLAFDTIYAEGQRRYIESLSSYARQFLEKMKKPEVDFISGLSPSISIEQKQFTHNPRSTVATVTEIYDFLRLLFAKAGAVHCYQCGNVLGRQSTQLMAEQVFQLKAGTEFHVLAPLVRGRKGEFKDLFQDLAKKGYSKAIVDGAPADLRRPPKLRKTKRHDIELVVDFLKAQPEFRKRLEESLRTALDFAGGSCVVRARERDFFFSEKFSCPRCDISLGNLAPNMFSFNSPYGACPACRGLGQVTQIASHLLIKDKTKPLLQGAINEEVFFSFNRYVIQDLVHELKEYYEFELKTPYAELSDEIKDAFLWGNDEITGLIQELRELSYSTSSEVVKSKVARFLREEICPDCRGGRLRKEVRGVRLDGRNITDVAALSVEEAVGFFKTLKFSGPLAEISAPVLKEVRERLRFLHDVGLGYLTLDRAVNTLAGGENQRIRLARQISVGLTGVLYVLDEPSIGLHPRDNEKLLTTLRNLCALKNTVIVVEHDEETIRQADYLIDLGPGAGAEGGEVVAAGEPARLGPAPRSLTVKYLARELTIEVPRERKPYRDAPKLAVRGAEEHNLKKIDVEFPLGLLVCVTGVSGSGKSTLVHDILFRALHNKIWKTSYRIGKHKGLEGAAAIDQVIEISQAPIGRTPRSNPATYTDLFVHIRRLFAQTYEARMRNFSPSRFSFNLKGGRCENCQGEGSQRLSMSFLPDLYVVCETCRGKRYNEQTLEVKYKDKTIAEVLDLSVKEALELFDPIPPVRERLRVLDAIGLGYVKLGQSSTTLSGGEAQRIKLASELGKRSTGRTLYILDEPTTGLHFADIQNLLKALFALRDAGNTVLVIEHNLDVVKTADYLIDLGPEGGRDGGRVVATGTPEEVARKSGSYTGLYLKKILSSRS
ncbi:MAG: excinuclease ABC subunit UvrA [Candidatus Omnitrophica bacterium]|nr:excinuclease ABC subunit UvrA [Candidatus Omnitrophota bacterium]